MTEPSKDVNSNAVRSLIKRGLGWLNLAVPLKLLIVAGAALGVAVALFVVIGGVDISADAPDSWLTTNGLHFVFKRSVASAANRVTPPDDLASAGRVHLAAQHFDMVCANCHGRPGFGQSVTALSMSPRPQYLPKVVGQFSDAQLYEIVEHGVKYSAMPSWTNDTRGDEVWSMVAFLRQLPKLDAKAYRELTALPVTQSTAISAGDDARLQPANAQHIAPPVNEFLYAAPAAGFSDRTISDSAVPICARCHGVDGSGVVTGGEAPNLTIQDGAYLHAALDAYVSGGRRSGYMQTIAAELSGAQIDALSAYYANLPVQTAASAPANAALVKRGELIATQGIRDSATPACDTCHESQGSQIVKAPHIAGQSITFLRRQLLAMAHGGRGSSVMWNPMPAVAHALSDDDIAALAAYYSGLKPTKGAAAPPMARGPQDAPTGDMAAAKKIFDTNCVSCHVNNGRGDLQGNYPNLTIQATTYAAQSLYAYHAGTKLNNSMRQSTDSLTLDQMTSLARYINGMTPLPALAKPDSNAAMRGAALATKGATGRGIPACLGCHGASGVAALPLVPALQGQNVGYLRTKLNAFAQPYPENNNALNPMPAISRKLTDQERADLAAYFASVAPLQKTALH